jgi:hypothetical protein
VAALESIGEDLTQMPRRPACPCHNMARSRHDMIRYGPCRMRYIEGLADSFLVPAARASAANALIFVMILARYLLGRV